MKLIKEFSENEKIKQNFLINNVTKGISGLKAAYVLMHDTKSYSVDAVERIIQWGLANGYTFLPLNSSSPVNHHGVNN